jgi:glutamine synthetase
MRSPTLLQPEDLIFIGICDLAAQVRGKSVPVAELTSRQLKGVGYTPANICISAFGAIRSSPFGTRGDIVLLPDTSTEVQIAFADGATEHFCLADVATLDGDPWECCPRGFLRRALERLERVSNCTLLASFEQEFVYTGVQAEPKRAYALQSFREQGAFGAQFMAALRSAGMEPDAFLAEYGPRQYEVTVAPKHGMRAADEAVMLRELARAVAMRHGQRAIFAPMVEPDGTGNGTHIHMSLWDRDGEPAMHEAEGPYGLSEVGEQLIAGILDHMPALTAVTTPSVASYFRLTPNRWAPTWANVSAQDRAASLRVCPGGAASPAGAFNVEYRVADATACPYMALGALVHAGVDGIERRLTLPAPDEKDFGAMDDASRLAAGMRPLPRTLGEALGLLRGTEAAKEWFGEGFRELYLKFKAEEEEAVAGLEPQAICDRYAAIY